MSDSSKNISIQEKLAKVTANLKNSRREEIRREFTNSNPERKKQLFLGLYDQEEKWRDVMMRIFVMIDKMKKWETTSTEVFEDLYHLGVFVSIGIQDKHQWGEIDRSVAALEKKYFSD